MDLLDGGGRKPSGRRPWRHPPLRAGHRPFSGSGLTHADSWESAERSDRSHDPLRRNGTDRFYHGDSRGSTRYLTDSTGNTATQSRRYESFGAETTRAGTDGRVTDFLFAGGFGYQAEYSWGTEPGVGLQYLQQRYYDAQVGRFLTPDPIGFAGGFNVYGYCGNDPVNYVDPSGLIRLRFLGDRLEVYTNDGKLFHSIEAWSGLPGASRADQHVENRGPIPEGRYSLSGIFTRSIQPPDPPGGWGSFRTEINPTRRMKRRGFYLHGGKDKGSKGCVDLGPLDRWISDVLLSEGDYSVELIVDYSAWTGRVPRGPWGSVSKTPPPVPFPLPNPLDDTNTSPWTLRSYGEIVHRIWRGIRGR